MKTLLVAAAALAGLAAPAAAQAPQATSRDSTQFQSVYRTERVIEVMNYDGTVSETHIVTRYYLFGYE